MLLRRCSCFAVFVVFFLVGCWSGNERGDGNLKIFNWASYTSQEMIRKFEKEHGVSVELFEYESSEAALAMVKGQMIEPDIIVVASNYLPSWVNEGLLLEIEPSQLKGFENILDQWASPKFDPGRKFSIPWAWGVVGVAVHTDVFGGDINTWSVVLDPPKELKGKINVGADMNEVIYAAVRYHGGRMCDSSPELLGKVRKTLVSARPSWAAMEYGSVQKMASGHFMAGIDWNGAALRQRLINPTIRFGLPKEGSQIFSDNVVILKKSKNVTNAKLFMEFIMDPRNAAMNSSFHGYASAIAGAEGFLVSTMKGAPELNLPAAFLNESEFAVACSPEVQEAYEGIWGELQRMQ